MGAVSTRPTLIETLPTFKQLQSAVTNFDAKDNKAADRLNKAIKAFTLESAAPSAEKAKALRVLLGNPVSLPPTLRDDLRRTIVTMSGVNFKVAEDGLRTVASLRTEVLDMTDQWDAAIDTLRASCRGLARAYEKKQKLDQPKSFSERELGAAVKGLNTELVKFRVLLGQIDEKLNDLAAAVNKVLEPLGEVKKPELWQVTSSHGDVETARTILKKIEATPLSIGNADDALAVALTDARRLVRNAVEQI